MKSVVSTEPIVWLFLSLQKASTPKENKYLNIIKALLLEKIITSGNEVKYEKRESENKIIPPTNNNDGLSQGFEDPDESLPIINTEEQDEAYKDKIDKSSESDPIPVEDLLDGIILHSFNTFESGVEKDNDGNVRQYGSSDLYEKRIDSINGLIYLFKKYRYSTVLLKLPTR